MAITSKEINLEQLDQELGGQGLCGDFNDPKKKSIVPAENSTVTETQLEAAIKSHVAGPTQAQVIKLNREQEYNSPEYADVDYPNDLPELG
jgi:hypothetical protein